MKKKLILFFLLLCNSAWAQQAIKKDRWRVTMQLNDSTELPFNIVVKEGSIDILNAEEKIKVDEIMNEDDSVFINMPVFDSEFRGRVSKDSITGLFLNHARRDNNVIPFKATHDSERFKNQDAPVTVDLTGRWEVVFSGDLPPLNISVGEFKQHDHLLTGTFLTPTGDYRYLEGSVTKNQFHLSCFDGSHLFMFYGSLENDSVIHGHFYSGKHWHDTWTAKRNGKIKLPDADSLTFLKPGYDQISFSFPGIDSNMVSLSDKKFQHKVVIVQIMGTWCPNCMDETAFLAPFYKKYKSKGLEIIGLDFERISEFSKAKQNILRLKQRFNVDYTLLYAGSNDASLRLKALPMLNRILSFPTTIFIDRNKKVRRIHTGFSGPATGEHFEEWKKSFTDLVEQLVNEQ